VIEFGLYQLIRIRKGEAMKMRKVYSKPADKAVKSPVIKRSIIIAGHKTSVSLEDEFWSPLKEIADGRRITLSDLVAGIDANRQHPNLSSAIRLFVLGFYRDQIPRPSGGKQLAA
jgi:predicted DNA-binding ribbon-helix-helix protein